MMTVYYVFAMQLDKHIQWQTLARTAKMLLTMLWINIRCCREFPAFEVLSKARWVLAGKCRRNHVCTLELCKHWSLSLLPRNCSNIHFHLHHWQIFFFFTHYLCTSRSVRPSFWEVHGKFFNNMDLERKELCCLGYTELTIEIVFCSDQIQSIWNSKLKISLDCFFYFFRIYGFWFQEGQ